MPRLSSYATHLHASRPSNKSLSVLFRTVISTQIVTRDLCEATFASEIGPRDCGRPFGQDLEREREKETAWHLPDQRNRENTRLCHCGMHIFSSTSDDKSVKVMGDQNVDCNQGIK